MPCTYPSAGTYPSATPEGTGTMIHISDPLTVPPAQVHTSIPWTYCQHWYMQTTTKKSQGQTHTQPRKGARAKSMCPARSLGLTQLSRKGTWPLLSTLSASQNAAGGLKFLKNFKCTYSRHNIDASLEYKSGASALSEAMAAYCTWASQRNCHR